MELKNYTQREIYKMLGLTPTAIQEHIMDGFSSTMHSTRQQGATTGLIVLALWISQAGKEVVFRGASQQRCRNAQDILYRLNKKLNFDISNIRFSPSTVDDVEGVSYHNGERAVWLGYGHNELLLSSKDSLLEKTKKWFKDLTIGQSNSTSVMYNTGTITQINTRGY